MSNVSVCNSLPVSGRPQGEQEPQRVDTDHNHCYSYDIFHLDLKVQSLKLRLTFLLELK